MKKYFNMAWRNMWRNWRRTAIATVAIVLGLILLIFMDGLIRGSDQAMFGNSVRMYGGNIQVHAPGFRDKANRLPLLPIENPDSVVQAALLQPEVVSADKRIRTAGLVSSGGATAAVAITAVEPSKEAQTSLIAETISQGRYLQDTDEDSIIIGKGLADFLSVGIDDRITLLGQRKDESVRQRSMTIVGIFDLGFPEIEKGMVYISLPEAQTLYNLRGQVTEVAISLKQIGQEDKTIQALQTSLPNLEVDSWDTLQADLTSTMDIKSQFTTIFGMVVLMIASIGILNLMLMAVFERTREMGVLAALGWKGKQIMVLFLLEGMFIGAVGAIIGGILSWGLTVILGQIGIDFSFASQMGSDAVALLGDRIYPSVPISTILIYAVAVILIAALASLFPAWQASRQEPAKALRYV